ncbi:MAG: racemase [Desulfobacteraceae bacterium]|nr:racemase [Desulfobacteraceae bacterium]
MKITVIIPDNNADFNEVIEDAVNSFKSPDTEVNVVNINKGCDYIEGRWNIAINSPYVIEKAIEAENNGADGVFVTDFDFCGVEAIREVVNIPVIGAFRASAFTAMMVAETFSIITITKSVIAMQREHVKAFGVEPNFASIRYTDIPVLSLHKTDVLISKVYEESLKAIEEDGAQSIILGCSGMINVAEPVSKLLKESGKPAPVIDPNGAAVNYLELLIRNKLSQSRLTYYIPMNFNK